VNGISQGGRVERFPAPVSAVDASVSKLERTGRRATRSSGVETADAEQLEPLLSPTDVAAYLGVPVKTLYAWRYRREGPPALRVGRYVRYRRGDLEEWVRQRIAGESRFR
jgi:excisionase family DNA binding protein